MKLIVAKNYDEMSAEAAKIMADVIKNKPDCVLGLATGSTPVGMYACLVDMYNKGELDFSKVKSVNLDEYYPIVPEHDQSYRYFMNYNLFDKVNINKENTFVPDGTCADPAAFCKAYDERIDAMGGTDVQVLGIGRNGHIGFNEPDSELLYGTHLTDLTEDTIDANARFFASANDVPKQALTMGMGPIFKARKIILLANGVNKAEAIKQTLAGKVSTLCPSTLLTLHPDVTVICDEDAYSLVK